MPRPSVLSRITPEVRRRLHSREAWPPALLAETLGVHRATIYRLFPGRSPVPTEMIVSAVHPTAAGRRRSGETPPVVPARERLGRLP